MESCHKVRSEIDDTCRWVEHQPSKVRLLLVSKTVPADALVEFWPEFAAAGYAGLVENHVQEAVAKTEVFRDAFDGKVLHMAIIGPLQTSKAGHLVSCAGELQALDRSKVAGMLQRRLVDSERTLDVLIRVNAFREPQKSGPTPSHAAEFARMFSPDGEYPNLRLRGSMTITAQNDSNVRETFTGPRELRDSLLGNLPEGVSLGEPSTGMSGGYHETVAEGAVTVYVGRAIFGERSYREQGLRNRDSLITMNSDISPYSRRRFLLGTIATAADALVAACAPKSEAEKVDTADIPVGGGVVISSHVVT